MRRLRIAAQLHAAVHVEQPNVHFRNIRTLKTFISEHPFAEISADPSVGVHREKLAMKLNADGSQESGPQSVTTTV